MSARVNATLGVMAVGLAACALFVSVQGVGTWNAPYAPNNWAFSHLVLADVATTNGVFPLNGDAFDANDFRSTYKAFQEETGLPALSLYARAAWHFWNGIPLHPALVTSLALLTGLPGESVVRVPVTAVAVVLLAFAVTSRVLAHEHPPGDARLVALAPFLVAVASAPLALEARVLMPSVTLVFPLFLAFAMFRHALVDDRHLLALGIAPLLLLPFWYYTMAYFVILVFAGFVALRVLVRVTRARAPPRALFPWAPALGVPAFLALALVANGTLESHLDMVRVMVDVPVVDPGGSGEATEMGLDYGSHLYREPWRSVALYLGGLVLASGLLAVGARVLASWRRTRRVDAADAVFAQWIAGATVFSGVVVGLTNVSFLNRTFIYMTPIAVVALVVSLARARSAASARAHRELATGALVAGVAFMLVVTPVFVLTATPRYEVGDGEAFAWMGEHVPKDHIVYGPMEAVSPLLRAHGFTRGTAFNPTPVLVEQLWYGNDTEVIVPYVSSMDYFVLRGDQRVNGFEDFSPAREPLPPEAFEKFASSRDLHRTFDNGDVIVYRVALDPTRFRTVT